jgi:hypothetical protein
VKYESSRGLEGWTVVCLDYDLFFEKQLNIGKHIDRGLLQGQNEIAQTFAAQWALIPLTRAVDTLVLQIRGGGALSSAVLAAASDYRDFSTVVDSRIPT